MEFQNLQSLLNRATAPASEEEAKHYCTRFTTLVNQVCLWFCLMFMVQKNAHTLFLYQCSMPDLTGHVDCLYSMVAIDITSMTQLSE